MFLPDGMGTSSFIIGYFLLLSLAGTIRPPMDVLWLLENGLTSTENIFSAETMVSDQDYNSTVLFYLFTKSNANLPNQIWKGDENSLNSSDFSSSRKTLILTHGFMATSAFVDSLKNALLKHEDVNVIAVDWDYFTRNINYPWVVNNVEGVGTFIGQFVNFLIQSTGLSPEQVHLIGHSVGAHASGFAAKDLKAKGHTVARVSGLDPALPLFYSAGPDSRLASTDADFVDCIHTCSGALGYEVAICQADFYPNGGKHAQPGCPWWDIVCSHGRAFDFYAESIDPAHRFEASKCDDIVDGVPYDCVNNGALMGYPATANFPGEFYLITNSTPPYAINVTLQSGL